MPLIEIGTRGGSYSDQAIIDNEQSLFFLGPSSKTPETRKWPRAWLKARDGRGTKKDDSFFFSGCLSRFLRLAASPLNARALVHLPY